MALALVPVILASLLAVKASAQMPGGLEGREVDPRITPFVLKGSLSPESPKEDDIVEITGEISSRVHPHIRTVVRFWVDGEKREETSYVIAPRAESVVIHEWKAARGHHAFKIEVLSPADVLYTSWEVGMVVRDR
ncbi:MAG: hypothetical protein ACT4P2_04995 [Pseudomonadota bacterium]